MGLSSASYFTGSGWDGCIVSAESGRAVQLFPYDRRGNPKCKPPPRGEITGFSRSSRLRLLWLIAEIGVEAFRTALFLTLTYPRDDAKACECKTHLDTLLKRMKRAHPNSAALWKLEYTTNRTPHFHLILLGIPFWHHRTVAKAWAEIVQSENAAHAEAGTRVERLLSKRHAAKYLAKYVAKEGNYPEDHRGRVWGKTGSISQFLSPKQIWQVTRAQMIQIRRLLDRIRLATNRKRKFKRRSNLHNAQRWFLSGATMNFVASKFQLSMLPTTADG